jgi:Replication-relaxation
MIPAAGEGASCRERGKRLERLSALDLRLIPIVSQQRVVTQPQLELLVDDVPARTLRYRTRRLHQRGLLGRMRPYRERGSAQYHLWPTRAGDAMARGAPAPRGGERREPNPTFIAHAAALTGFYVAFMKNLPAGVELVSFAREAEAREPFRSLGGRQRAIAPDARIELEEDGRRLVGLLEVDLGTMSRRRLRAKARGYADYARAGGWRERHDFCPALLFATIATRRGRAFLEALASELGGDRTLHAYSCGLAREPARAVSEPVWRAIGGEALDLLAALRDARPPYYEERARFEEARRRERRKRERLLSDPAALREQLRGSHPGPPPALDGRERAAIELLVEGGGEFAEPEREALSALARMLADPLGGRWADREPGQREHQALTALAALLLAPARGGGEIRRATWRRPLASPCPSPPRRGRAASIHRPALALDRRAAR